MKLLLSSFGPSPAHDGALVDLVSKPLDEIRVGYIENAHDVYDDPAALGEGVTAFGADLCERDGYTVVRVNDAQALVIDGDQQRMVGG